MVNCHKSKAQFEDEIVARLEFLFGPDSKVLKWLKKEGHWDLLVDELRGHYDNFIDFHCLLGIDPCLEILNSVFVPSFKRVFEAEFGDVDWSGGEG